MLDNKNSDIDSDSAHSRVVLIASGNAGRGDSGLARVLVEELREVRGELPTWLTVIEDDALALEHILALRGQALALFITTNDGPPGAVDFSEITASANPSETVDDEPLAPAEVLRVMHALARQTAVPASFAMALSGRHFDAGASQTDNGRESLRKALALLTQLLEAPSVQAWRSRVADTADCG